MCLAVASACSNNANSTDAGCPTPAPFAVPYARCALTDAGSDSADNGSDASVPKCFTTCDAVCSSSNGSDPAGWVGLITNVCLGSDGGASAIAYCETVFECGP
jgi:hypothetical protein